MDISHITLPYVKRGANVHGGFQTVTPVKNGQLFLAELGMDFRSAESATSVPFLYGHALRFKVFYGM